MLQKIIEKFGWFMVTVFGMVAAILLTTVLTAVFHLTLLQMILIGALLIIVVAIWGIGQVTGLWKK